VNARRSSPFCLRLTLEERARLEVEAGREPLGRHIKSRLFDGNAPKKARAKPSGGIKDQRKLAAVLAQLGKSQLGNNVNQLAKAMNLGELDVDDETRAAMNRAAADISAMRLLLMQALGLKLDTPAPGPVPTRMAFSMATEDA
jgi:hypothetical protein